MSVVNSLFCPPGVKHFYTHQGDIRFFVHREGRYKHFSHKRCFEVVGGVEYAKMRLVVWRIYMSKVNIHASEISKLST